MSSIAWFLAGLFVGANFGVAVMAIVSMAKDE